MADLLARFRLVDEMSDRLEKMAQAGQSMADRFERVGASASAAFDSITGGAGSAVYAVDGVVTSISEAMDSLSEFGDAAEQAAARTDYWTDAVGNYDRSVLEAVYSTQELVDMGLKSADALTEQQEALDLCERAAGELSEAIDEAQSAQGDLTSAIEKAAQTAGELADSEKVSAEAKEELARTSESAQEALDELSAAQERAEQAMADYDRVLSSGTENLNELEEAARSAADAAADLDAANERASNAAEELADATGRAADEAKKSSDKGQDAISQLNNMLAAAGITVMVKEIAGAFMEASNAAAEFEVGIMKISTIADTSTKSLGTISGEIMALSRETGDSVNELSEAVYSAISASVDTADAVAFTGTATKLAAGGFTSSATAVDVLTTALNAYGLEANKAESISDMLITTQNLGKTTVDELAASVGKVIPLASAYGVEMDNLSAGYAELTKGGIATAEAGTYLKAMLNELGKESSTVATTIKAETGSSFAELMEQGYSLGDVMEILGNSVDGNATAFNNLWSSTEAGVGALSLYNAGAAQFNTTLSAMQSSAGAASAAYEAMNSTLADSQEDLANAVANFQIVIGQQINPLVEKFYGLGTDALNLMTDFASENPIVVKALTALGITLGVAAVAVAGVAARTAAVTFATETAIPAVVKFGVAFNSALGPIGWVTMGIGALTVAVGAFIAMNEENLGETEGMTAVTRAQYYELEALSQEYEKACEQYGETSEEASRLRYQMDDLSASFEANRQTVEQFTARADALSESVQDISGGFDSATTSIQDNEAGSLALIQKYDDLANKANLTAAEEQALAAVTRQLSTQYPELADQLNSATGSTEDYVDALKKACEQEAENRRQQQAQETYIEALQKQASLEDEIAKAKENIRLEEERMSNMSGWDHFWTSGEYDDLKAYQAALEELSAAEEENNALIAEINQGWENLAKTAAELEVAQEPLTDEEIQEAFERQASALQAVQEGNLSAAAAAKVFGISETELNTLVERAASYNENLESAISAVENGYLSAEEAASAFGVTLESIELENSRSELESLTQRMEDLGEAYNSAYEDAYTSFQGQFGLFDTASTKSKEYLSATVENAQKALESQLAYWESYGASIDTLKGTSAEALGITQENYDALMSYVQSGTEEAAGLAASMSKAIESGNTEAVAALANTLGEVNAKQDEIASATADWKTDFTAQMDEIEQKMQETIDGLDLSDEANAAATATISSYAESIRAGKADALEAAQEVADAVASALSSAQARINVSVSSSGTLPGHAAGTTNAEDVFVAGEEGPELIVGRAGSTVFPAEETEKIVSAISGMNPAPVTAADGIGKPVSFQSITNMRDSYDQSRYDAGDVLNRYDTQNLFTTENNYTSTSIDNRSTVDSHAQEISNAYDQSISNAVSTDDYSISNTIDESTHNAGDTFTETNLGDVFTDDHSIANAFDQSNYQAGDILNRYGSENQLDEVTNLGDTLSDDHSISNAYEQSVYNAENTLNRFDAQNLFDTSYSYGDTFEEDHSIGDTIDQSSHRAGDVLNRYDAQNRFDSAYSYGDTFEDDHSIGDTIDQSVHNIGDTFTTYEAQQTDREAPAVKPVLPSYEQAEETPGSTGGVSNEKRIVIEIAGGGSFQVSGGGVSEDAVIDLLMQNMKPVLMQTLRDEIFEEGDGSYEY